jgi:hypothetical protein
LIIIVILLPLIGSVLWFAIGRDHNRSINLGGFGGPRRSDSLPRAESITERELAALEREIEREQQDDRIRRLEAKLHARQGDTASKNSDA